MAPKSSSPTLQQRIRQELSNADARAAELRIALKVIGELGPDSEAAIDEPEVLEDAEARRIILKPSDDVPEAVKARLGDRTEAAKKLADSTLELERN